MNKERAAAFGLSPYSVGMYLRAFLDGITAATYYRNGEEIDVIVRLGETGRLTAENLQGIFFVTSDGRKIPFSAVCSLSYETSPAAVKRIDGKREITITAEAYSKDNIRSINRDMENFYDRTYRFRYPGMSFTTGGEFAEFNNLLIKILRIFLLGVFLIYIILGTQFRSYLQPFLILFSVPLAFAGVVLFLFLSRTPFSTTVLYAGVALAGISVNDAIVLISFINEQRSGGKDVKTAVIEAAGTRIRPIILTSITTIAGLLPTAVGLGGKSPVWGPMAGTIIFGLLFSTAAALIFVPCLYGALFDRKKKGSA